LYGLEDAPSILQQTRRLHQDTSTTLALSESLRLQVASMKQLQRVMRRVPDTPKLVDLKDRLEDVIQLLDYYEVTAQTVLSQQQNLLSLVCGPAWP